MSRERVLLAIAIASGLGFGVSTASAEVAVGTTSAGLIVTFDTANPGVILTSNAVTGLAANEVLLGIDTRPANGFIYGIGSLGGIYTLTPGGTATQVSTSSTVPSGDFFGVDFNPVPDRMRVVSTNNQNLRINVDTGAAIVDGTLNISGSGNSPFIVDAAYINNRPGVTATTLYTIDSRTDVLNRQVPPNNGTQVLVGSLGIDINSIGGFDVSGVSDRAFASLILDGGSTSRLYEINLGTGTASDLGLIGSGLTLTSFTLLNIPEPSALGLLAPAAVTLLRRRK